MHQKHIQYCRDRIQDTISNDLLFDMFGMSHPIATKNPYELSHLLVQKETGRLVCLA